MPQLSHPTLGLGVVGMGGFGLFATQHFLQIPDTRLVAIAGTFREAAQQAARRFGADLLETPAELVQRDDVDLVYLATPPFLHFEQAMRCLQHGKHVICEKPLCLTPDEGRALLDEAARRDLLLITNLMQRYNPLIDRVKKLVDERLLGEPIHGFFENYASDEGLSPEHWFWDESKSGGILIEHGVHFFDLMEGWLGPGTVEAAQAVRRPGSGVQEQVQATVRYGDVLVNFYHGFTQPGRLDRQELRLVFERGDLTLHEWVPTRLVLRGIVDEEQTRRLLEIFPKARLDISASYGGAERQQRGRFKPFDAFQQIVLHFDEDLPKQHLYGHLLREMFREQTDYLRGRTTERRITPENGLRSLETAFAAKQLLG